MARKREFPVGAVLSVVFGILIIVFDDFLAWFVGLYLIINGLLRLR